MILALGQQAFEQQVVEAASTESAWAMPWRGFKLKPRLAIAERQIQVGENDVAAVGPRPS